MTKTTLILSAIALLAIGFVLGVVGTKALPTDSLGGVSYDATHLVGDVYQGKTDTLIFRNGAFQSGPIATSSLFTSTGGITNSGALTQSGTSTFSASVTATKAATLQCPVVYNGATTTTAYYLYATASTTLNGGAFVIGATTTKPALCP